MRKRVRGIATVVALLVAIVAPVVAAVSVVRSARGDVTARDDETWAVANPGAGALEVPALVLMEWTQPRAIPAPAWSGLVEEVLVQPGDAVTTGTSIARVDRVVRIATNVGTPIGRSLAFGDSGPDVRSLNQTLAALGHPASDGDHFTRETRDGVRALAESLGAGPALVFDPAWLVFLPDGDGRVAAVDLAVASPAPSPGQSVLSLQPTLVRAKVVDPTDVPPPSDPTGEGGQPAVDLDEVSGSLPIVDGAVVVLAEAEVPVPTTGEFEGEQLAVLGGLVPAGTASIRGTLDQAVDVDLVQVPAAAVVTGPTGATCVVTRADGATDVRRVEVLDSYIGTSYISGLDVGIEVRVAPPAALRSACR